MAAVKRKVDNTWLNSVVGNLNRLVHHGNMVYYTALDLAKEVVDDRMSSLSVFDEFEKSVADLKKDIAVLPKISKDAKSAADNLRNKKNLDFNVIRRINRGAVTAASKIDIHLSKMVNFLKKKRLLVTDLTPEEAVIIVESLDIINKEFRSMCIVHNLMVSQLNRV